MEQLTHQEEQLMLIIWQLGEGVVKDFIQKMEEPHPPYTTVASIVKNLERKGYLSSKLYGNTYLYTAIIKEEDYKKRFLSNVVKDYFENSYKEMVSFFARNKKISSDELQEIIKIIEGKE